MKNQFKFVAMAACVALSAGFTSCSDDDDDNNGGDVVIPGSTSQVFPTGVPSDIDGMKISTDAQGRVTEIKDGNETTTFEYGTFSRATEFNAKMTVKDSEYPEDDMEFYFQLNERGFVTYALEVYVNSTDSIDDEWRFGYNSDGQLNYMKRSEGGNEVTTVTYTNGDITSVNFKDDEGENSVCDITYTNDDIKTPIANVSGLMLFDETFGIDMDEMSPAYFAGLLGRATKNLPLRKQWKGESGYDLFSWTLNSKNQPVKLTVTEVYGENTGTSEYNFAW